MKIIIAAETFSLTDAIREHTEQALDKVEAMLPEEATVRVFLRKDGHDSFGAVIMTHLDHKEIVSHDSGPDLYNAISESSNRLKGMLRHIKTKKMKSRRQNEQERAIEVAE